MLPDFGVSSGLSTGWRARIVERIVCGVAVGMPMLAWAPAAHAQSSSAEVRRTLRSSAFFGAELNARMRGVVYTTDAEPGPDSNSELRASAYGSGDAGPFGLYLGLGAIVRPSGLDRSLGDPFADPYDDFKFGRGLRLFSAHVEYVTTRERGAPKWSVRLGRLTDFDRSARLLMFDGVRVGMTSSDTTLFVYGGRRALSDGGLADDRNDALSQLVAGAGARVSFGPVGLSAAYRLEALHRVITAANWHSDDVWLELGVEARLGGQGVVTTYGEVYGRTDDDLGAALIVRHDGNARTANGRLSIDWRGLVQLGTDPVTFGRGGLGPDQTDVEAALGAPAFESPLDRLFLGPNTAHVLGDVEVRYWPVDGLALAAGAYARQPLSTSAKTSFRPGIVEVYGGPEVRIATRHRVGVEARYAWESPGSSERIFDDVGDGERRSAALRLYGDLPFPIGDAWRVVLRPEAETVIYATVGPLSTTDNQAAYFAGLSAVAAVQTDFFLALRYGAGTQPTFFADGVRLIHDAEITLGGRY